MVRDEKTGLLLPPDTRRKEEETWTYDSIRKLRYAAKDLHSRQVTMMLVCEGCQSPIALSGSGQLECQCKVRRIIQ